MRRVTCLLCDCVHFHKPNGKGVPADACDCSHPDKEMYLQGPRCPLYKKNWQQLDANAAAALAARFSRKRL
ncbi:hypothetical protein HZA57_07305 [Candidatus Poribacteria bacterium]|nr:hypothetical protein [Candidatus Poribacteria bacterium]